MVSPRQEQGPAAPFAAKAPLNPKPTDETIKETFESIVIAFILAFIFRAFVVEAFVIPTGSMAPTLLGQHVRVTDAQSGYVFNVDADGPALLAREQTAVSPMTRFPNVLQAGTRTRAGDRILVQKYIYMISEPKRWDVVVFKNPQALNDDQSPGPSINYIKRLIGLPDEQLTLFDGNVYAKPVGNNPFAIARKTDRSKLQRAVFQPIYHSQFIPLDGGHDREHDGRSFAWQTPWVAQGDTQSQWQIDGRRSYVYTGTKPGEITFDFARGDYHRPDMMYPYNQLRRTMRPEPIEDVRVAVTIEPAHAGLALELSTTARLNNRHSPIERLVARVDALGKLTLEAMDPKRQTAGRALAQPVEVGPLVPGRSTQVELWYVDQEASVWIDGQKVTQFRYELTLEQLKARPAPASLPKVRIGISQGSATLHQVQLDRDLYYAVRPLSQRARGGLERMGEHVIGEPLRIGADQFFCMGDNSPMSHDGRFWGSTDAWVKRRLFPYNRDPNGLVPRELMVGRAFFVYFPAPFPYRTNRPGVFPNFADMRFIH